MPQSDRRGKKEHKKRNATGGDSTLTDHHESELKALLDRLAVNLVGQVGKSNIPWCLWV